MLGNVRLNHSTILVLDPRFMLDVRGCVYSRRTLGLLKRRTDAEAECTEDGRDGRIGATEYAGGDGTRKRGRGAEQSEETEGDAERIT